MRCEPEKFGEIRDLLEKEFKEPIIAKLIWNIKNYVTVNKEEEKKLYYIIELLEENDDVQNIYTNEKVISN